MAGDLACRGVTGALDHAGRATEERGLLRGSPDYRLARHDLDELIALIDGLRDRRVRSESTDAAPEAAPRTILGRPMSHPGRRACPPGDTPSRRTTMSTPDAAPPHRRTAPPASRWSTRGLLARPMNSYSPPAVRAGDGADAGAAAPPQGDDRGRAVRDEPREVGRRSTPASRSWPRLSVAEQIGCSWCMDFGYYLLAHQRDADREAGAGAELAREHGLHAAGAQGAGVRRGDDRHSPDGHRRDGGRAARGARPTPSSSS